MPLSKLFRIIQRMKGYKSNIRNAVEVSFEKHLLLTNIGISGVLMFVSDFAQQQIEYQRHMLPVRYDWHRSLRMTIVAIIFGPLNHCFYISIYKLWPERTLANVGKKILSDQFVITPVGIAVLFYCAGLMEGKTWESCTEEIRNKWRAVYAVDWCVFPPTQFINFYYLPVKYQVLYYNVVTMLYNVFLSYIKHKEVAQQHLNEYKAVKLKESEKK